MLGFYEKGNPDNIVLIRINGNGTDKFLDRTAEVKNFLNSFSVFFLFSLKK